MLRILSQDSCLAEVSLSLALAAELSVPEVRPVSLDLSVRTLQAELHEGFFQSELLRALTSTERTDPHNQNQRPSPDETENDSQMHSAALRRFHRYVPQKVNVELENTNVTLSMNSQKRHLNWTLKSLSFRYGREEEQLPLKGFTPEISLPQTNMEFLVEEGLLLSQSRQRILCLNSFKAALQATSLDVSGSVTVNTCIIHYRHQEFSHWLNLFPWKQLHKKPVQRKRRSFPRLDAPIMVKTSVSNVNVSVQLGDTPPFAVGFISASADLQHLMDFSTDVQHLKTQSLHQRATLSVDHFWWRVGDGSHIQQAPHPPGKHVWGEALVLDSLNLQGHCNKPQLESASHPETVFLDSSVRGLQVEVSDTCTQCLSRVLSLLSRDPGQSSPGHPDPEPAPLCASALRVDAVTSLCSVENSQVSVRGLSLALVKSLTENIQPCCKASDSAAPIVSLASLAVSYHTSTWALEIQCDQELAVQWTPGDHMFLYQHFLETLHCGETLASTVGRSSRAALGDQDHDQADQENAALATDQTDQPPTLTPKEGHAAAAAAARKKILSINLKLKSTRLTAFVTEKNFISLQLDSLSLVRHGSSVEARTPEVVLNLDGNNIFTFKGAEVRMASELQEMMQHRDQFPNLLTQKNSVWVFTFPVLSVEFPYLYDFSSTIDEAINVQKWLKNLHRKPREGPEPLPPDLVFRVSQFSFVFLDDVFEIKLRDNYELMKDESKESAKRLQLLDKKVSDLRKQHGELLPARKIEELYTSLERKNIEIYIQRSRRLYSNTPMRKSLLTWTVSDLEVVALADRSFHGPERVKEQMKDIDPISPLPRDSLPLVIQWCRAVKFSLTAFLGE
ncbi:UNVERIFIED_CONTAM: hypothetical protein FKN15_027356 [Acipenser sinensis]